MSLSEMLKCYNIVILFFVNLSFILSQSAHKPNRIYFISDVQAPMRVEKIVLKAYKNEAARDSLFADLLRQNPKNLFILGDLSMKGSKEKAWVPLDVFMNSLKKSNTKVYAIPGNHEYMGKDSKAKQNFVQRFNEKSLNGYAVIDDSMAVVMLNSNFKKKLSKDEISKQLAWYKSSMDSLDNDSEIKAIIVCTHHPAYSNSEIISTSEEVADLFVPHFDKSPKTKLFISGHSHNLEYFANSAGKHFLIIGGGGGIAQPLVEMKKRQYIDLLSQEQKPLYFYLIIERMNNSLRLVARGFKKDFEFFEFEIGEVTLY